jgi:TatD DNase family protein
VFVDSHAHLEFAAFDGERDTLIERALKGGVMRIVSIGTRLDNWEKIYKITQKHEAVFMTAGVHPCDVETHDLSKLKHHLEKFLKKEKVVGVGESGLDFYHRPFDQKKQEESFSIHIEAARSFDVPVVVHSREAEGRTTSMLKEAFQAGPIRAVLHCFSGSLDMTKACLDLGCYFSTSGILTFKNATNVREVFSFLPLDRILIETDAPYLAPHPFRGKRNEPAYVVHTAQKLADIKNLTLEEVGRLTSENFFALFSKVPKA